MSLSAASRSFTTTPPTSTPPSSIIIPHRRLSRKRIPSPPRTVLDFSAFESSRVPQVSLHTYPSTSSLADLYASHGRITPSRRSPVGSRCSSRGGARVGFDGFDELQMFAAVIPTSQANIHLPPTPPSGSGGEGDDDDGGVPLTLDFDGVFGTSPRNRRVLRRVKANIHDVSPPSQPNSASMSVASDSTTTLNSPPTPPKEQVVMVLHHPRPLSKSPKSAYFEDSFLTSGLHMQPGSGGGLDRYYYGAGGREGYLLEDKLEPRFESDEKDDEPFEVRRAESIKVTKAESIKVRKVEEIETRKTEELEVGKVEEPEVTKVETPVELKEPEQFDAGSQHAPIQVNAESDQVEANIIAKDEPEHKPKLNEGPAEVSLQILSPTLEPVVFSESDFETATEYGESDTETIVIKLQTTVQEQKQREEEEARKERDNDEDDENRELLLRPVTGKERRKPTPWPTTRVNSYASSTDRKAETGSPFSEDGDLIFHDALSSPLGSPVTTPREEELSLPNLTTPITPKKKSELVISFGPTPTRSDLENQSSSTSVFPEAPKRPPPLPMLNVIPATPMPLASPLEKELGHYPIPILERRPTEIPTLLHTVPTVPLAAPIVPVRLKKAQRPSLQSQPKRLRESKLHPWWRPRLEGGEDEGLSRTFTAESQASEYSVAHNSGTGEVGGKRGGRVTKKIKGTKFQIEFIGLGTLREKVKVAGEKTSGLGRRITLRKRV